MVKAKSKTIKKEVLTVKLIVHGKHTAGLTSLSFLSPGGKSYPVRIHDVQRILFGGFPIVIPENVIHGKGKIEEKIKVKIKPKTKTKVKVRKKAKVKIRRAKR